MKDTTGQLSNTVSGLMSSNETTEHAIATLKNAQQKYEDRLIPAHSLITKLFRKRPLYCARHLHRENIEKVQKNAVQIRQRESI